MPISLFGSGEFQGLSNTAAVLTSGTLETYEPGTSTNKATYPTRTDAENGTNANSTPVTLDSGGRAQIWLDGRYKLVLKDSSGSTIWTVDEVGMSDTVFDDNIKTLYGTGSDASIYYDGTDMIIDPQEVGSGNLKLNAGSLEIKTDNQKLLLGAGEDAALYYDGTNLVIDPQEVGSGATVFNAGNVGIGTSTFGTSADKVLALVNGTAPSDGPANSIQLYSVDLSAGNTILGIRSEGTPESAGSATIDRTVAIAVNGTVRYFMVSDTAAA